MVSILYHTNISCVLYILNISHTMFAAKEEANLPHPKNKNKCSKLILEWAFFRKICWWLYQSEVFNFHSYLVSNLPPEPLKFENFRQL